MLVGGLDGVDRGNCLLGRGELVVEGGEHDAVTGWSVIGPKGRDDGYEPLEVSHQPGMTGFGCACHD